MVKVLVVEDSPVARQLLKHILSSDPEIKVIGTVEDGVEALEFIKHQIPDVITMDIIMPRMDGYETTRRIMRTNPVPIVIVSASIVKEEVDKTWRAIEAGAVAVLEKPKYSDISGETKKLVQTVKLMAQVKVVRRWNRTETSRPEIILPDAPSSPHAIKVVAIGASTGGPAALREILSLLPKNFRVPVLVVQHITPGFTQGFVDWLNQHSRLQVRMPKNGDQAIPGHVYVAPDSVHMETDSTGKLWLVPGEPKNGVRPSVSNLFQSVAAAFGDKAVGVLLTGMGSDGASDLKLMRDKGAVTIAQEKESCIVFGMPGEAMKIGAAKYFLTPSKIAELLKNLVKK